MLTSFSLHTTSFVLIIICVTSFWNTKWLHQHGTMSPNAQQTNCMTRFPRSKNMQTKKPINEVVCLPAWSCLSPNSLDSKLPACLSTCPTVAWLGARVFHTGGLWRLGAAMQRLQMRGLTGKIETSVSS